MRALLAYLVVETSQAHRRGVLAALLWPERSESNARANLSQALFNLRSVLGDRSPVATPGRSDASQALIPFLMVDGQMIQFSAAADYRVDVLSFLSLVRPCADHTHPPGTGCEAYMQRLGEAVALYRGPFLGDLAIKDSVLYEEWAAVRREELHRQALESLSRLAAFHERRSEYERGLSHARRLVDLEPWQEEGQRQLMRLLALSGQRGAALEQYEACRRALAQELGVQPEQQAIALYEGIRNGTTTSHPGTTPQAPTPVLNVARPAEHAPVPLPTNLPAQALPFVGRERLLDDVLTRLRDPTCRLLTLVGPGGCGKTRLAIEAGKRLLGSGTPLDDAADGAYVPADGVFLVSLAPLYSPKTIVPTIAAAVGCSLSGRDPRPPEVQLLDHLRHKAMLLIMDNCEHLLPEMRLVSAILEAAPEVKVLATTRERLNVQGEHLLPVSGMDLPEVGGGGGRSASECGVVQLFLQGAWQVRPGYEPDAEELEQIARVCRRVQGMPLAIVLATGWMVMLRPGEIDAQIARSLDFLSGGARNLPDRQRSVRATFEHSWRLLAPEEQSALAALSVCRGRCDYEAACAVSGATLIKVRALVDKSLLQMVAGGRFEMHELLRQYAAESLALFRQVGEHRWIAQAQMQVGWMACQMGRGCVEAQQALEESVMIHRQIDDRRGLARTLGPLAMVVAYGGDLKRAERLAREALAIAGEGGERVVMGVGTFALGDVLIKGSGFAEAESLLERAIADPVGANDQILGVENYAAASQHPQIAASRWWADVVGRHVTAAASALSPEVVARARERGRAADVQAALCELLAELS